MSEKWVHVVAAIITNEKKEYLLAKRPLDKHKGGLWEFVGGKVEKGEGPRLALARELKEEIGIEVHDAEPFTQIRHKYPEKNILLDVWSIKTFSGKAFGKEGQEVRWFSFAEMLNCDFPEANTPILKALTLPSRIAITPSGILNGNNAQQIVSVIADSNVDALIIRDDTLESSDYESFFCDLIKANENEKIKLIITRQGLSKAFKKKDFWAVHHKSREINNKLEGVKSSLACHSLDQLTQGEKLGYDFLLLSPINQTSSHPEATPLTWERAKEWIAQVNTPVYLLGGINKNDLEKAREIGAIGIAGISDFFPEL